MFVRSRPKGKTCRTSSLARCWEGIIYRYFIPCRLLNTMDGHVWSQCFQIIFFLQRRRQTTPYILNCINQDISGFGYNSHHYQRWQSLGTCCVRTMKEQLIKFSAEPGTQITESLHLKSTYLACLAWRKPLTQ